MSRKVNTFQCNNMFFLIKKKPPEKLPKKPLAGTKKYQYLCPAFLRTQEGV